MFHLKVMGLTGKIALVMILAGVGLQTTRWTTVSMVDKVDSSDWKNELVTEVIQGKPLEIQGAVYDDHGLALAGVQIEVHQTDAAGPNDRTRPNTSVPRFKQALTTDDRGNYHYKTTIPKAHSVDGPPAHVHFVVHYPDGSAKAYDLWLDEDRGSTIAKNKTNRLKDRVGNIQPLEKGRDGVWRSRLDFRP